MLSKNRTSEPLVTLWRNEHGHKVLAHRVRKLQIFCADFATRRLPLIRSANPIGNSLRSGSIAVAIFTNCENTVRGVLIVVLPEKAGSLPVPRNQAALSSL